jgi:BirA family biotin operon repressor/biotin-[acetyl-CoA-carboxylase] ligase
VSRNPLRLEALRAALLREGGLWTGLEVLAETGSTNTDLAAAARAGAPEGAVLVAEHQRAGRGRIGRGWISPPRAGLTVSVLLRPPVPPARWGWLPLLAGVALVEAVELGAAALKWPNDLLVGERKCAGILVDAVGEAAVVGIGLNVTHTADELPDGATSLALAGARTTDREPLLRAVLDRIEHWYGAWRAAGGDPDRCGLRDAYRERCATVGRAVRVALPGGAELTGEAESIDREGRLLVRTAGGSRAVAAGDIVHVRACGSGAEGLR